MNNSEKTNTWHEESFLVSYVNFAILYFGNESYTSWHRRKGAQQRSLLVDHFNFNLGDIKWMTSCFPSNPKRIQATLTHRVYWKALRSSLRCYGRRVEFFRLGVLVGARQLRALRPPVARLAISLRAFLLSSFYLSPFVFQQLFVNFSMFSSAVSKLIDPCRIDCLSPRSSLGCKRAW